jgi:hypothetical protein
VLNLHVEIFKNKILHEWYFQFEDNLYNLLVSSTYQFVFDIAISKILRYFFSLEQKNNKIDILSMIIDLDSLQNSEVALVQDLKKNILKVIYTRPDRWYMSNVRQIYILKMLYLYMMCNGKCFLSPSVVT